MESLHSRFYKAALRITRTKTLIEHEFATGNFISNDCPEPSGCMQKKHIITKQLLNGRPVYTLKSKTGSSGKTVLYLHGGAYVHNITKYHWRFISRLIDATRCTFVVPDYPLAPQNTYMQSFNMIDPLYRELANQAGAGNFMLMGDSAGGGFALALAQKMKTENEKQPARIILLSPWLDIALTNPETAVTDRLDPFLGIEGLRIAGKSYAGSTSTDHYLLSPVHGPVEGLAPVSLFIGTHDILEPDCRMFRYIAETKGVIIDYHEYPRMIHVWMLLSMPEAKKALKQIAARLMQT